MSRMQCRRRGGEMIRNLEAELDEVKRRLDILERWSSLVDEDLASANILDSREEANEPHNGVDRD